MCRITVAWAVLRKRMLAALVQFLTVVWVSPNSTKLYPVFSPSNLTRIVDSPAGVSDAVGTPNPPLGLRPSSWPSTLLPGPSKSLSVEYVRPMEVADISHSFFQFH